MLNEAIRATSERLSSGARALSDEELFDVVMENVISSVEYYGWVNYKRDQEKNGDEE